MRPCPWKRIALLVVTTLMIPRAVPARVREVITYTQRDVSGDGVKDVISISMASGTFYKANDPADKTCPSCMCGSAKFAGSFEIGVLVRGRGQVKQSLNALMGGFERLEFWAEPWQIVFDDYNGDGQIDFNLGQYFSCNGWAYRLFTIAPDGRVSRLDVEEGNPDSEIFASDDSNSTKMFSHTATGFYTRGYYNAATPVGFYTSYYNWDKEKRLFVFEKDVYDRNQKRATSKPHWARED
ncbi:MAG TPA: hypothetical protein VJT09_05435 [Pyrinomonadaceae bacterium]|nr:hypothetical protein [Pyrinomonadaceae bacterium]